MSLEITPVSVEGTEDVALPSSGAFFVSIAMAPYRVSHFHVSRRIICGLYVVETELEENSSHCAACDDVCRGRGEELSAFPGNILTSSVTDSRDMANDSLDCSDHRCDEHENHQQGSNNGT